MRSRLPPAYRHRHRRSVVSSAILRFLRQRQDKACAPLARALHAHTAAVTLDDGFDDPQPQSESRCIRFGISAALEALEDRARGAFRHTRTFVLHPDFGLRAATLSADTDGAALRGELGGIGDQVYEHLAETLRIAAHDRADARFVQFDAQLA